MAQNSKQPQCAVVD